MSTLEAKNITKQFGEILALNDISLSVGKNTILGLIGPNGSGKTTFINLVTCFYATDHGDLFFNGKRINGFKPHEISRIGIGRTFQEARVFKKMTVIENVLAASPNGIGRQSKETARDLLKFVELFDLKNEYSGNLSYGQQKLLELARILMRDPQLILLDEPTAGINPVLIEKLLEYFRVLRDQGKTLIIVEHNIPVINDICEKAIVLDHGQKIAEGTPEEIQRNKIVQDVYLGVG
ncbi:MAG: ABC transporter ATP-binding protein [Candidatus Bathyarchaeota archaeon]|nr:ABC transporter ATP-binding protein [Candidatus Bathyarchaeota archaeon]